MTRLAGLHKHILLVDEEPALRRWMALLLAEAAPEVRVTWASNGAGALHVLERGGVDLLITSLAIPVIPGSELLRHLANRRSLLPVIVMSEHEPAPAEARTLAGCRVAYHRDPLEPEPLLRGIQELLDERPTPRGVTLADLLVVLRLERRTCSLHVSTGETEGILYFAAGALIDARHGEVTGMSAALEILSWTEPVLALASLARTRTQTIFGTHEELLEAVRMARAGSEAGHAPTRAEAVWERPAAQAKLAGVVAAALEIDGAVAAALSHWELDHGLCVRGGHAARCMENTLSGHCRVMRIMATAMTRLGMSTLRDLLISSEDGRLDILAPLCREDGLFLWVGIDRRRGSLALARRRVQQLVGELVL